jgi:PB1 domain
MIDGHYLNLPVMNETGEIVGMVDVLKLTYATLEQINTMGSGESEGPAWNKFWLSMDNDSESMMSGEGSHRPTTPGHGSMLSPDATRPPMERGDSVMPNESASHHGDDDLSEAVQPTAAVPEDTPFPFKFKAPSGRVHRLQVVASAGMADLIANVTSKLGSEVDAVGGEASVDEGKLGKAGYALSYMDNEGDTVSITTDQDLVDAIALARQGRREKVDLFVHDPAQPPLAATLDPRPNLSKPPTPPESVLREKADAAAAAAESDEEVQVKRAKGGKQAITPMKEEQLIGGVPNELLLPGAIVTLAVVIVGVFAFSRTGSK